jgi:glutamine amidotransferase
MRTAVIKYNAGNTQSVLFALERIGVNAIVTDDPELIKSSEKVIFPGVGEASSAMSYLRKRGLDELILSLTQPVLGICLGMQLMCKYSEEGDTTCLGIFDTDVKLFNSSAFAEVIKVPHMGWNTVTNLHSDLYKGIAEKEYMYFVHSYYVPCAEHTIATAHYGLSYSASLKNNNFYATQFHPEKSGEAGQLLLKNFINL